MLIMKFGGSSIAKPKEFFKITKLIIERIRDSRNVAIVVSAMGNTTDRLSQLAYRINPKLPLRELDMLISSGERMSAALLAMALSAQGIEARSFTGSQAGIITTNCHCEAQIIDVRPHRLLTSLGKGNIPIVAGFQGMSLQGEITTLGRGGTDTTAVALAIALKSSVVEFYKDVPGVFNRDPKQDPKAHHLPNISHSEALEITMRGAKILHSRAVALAKKNGITLIVRSFKESGETIIESQIEKKEDFVFEAQS